MFTSVKGIRWVKSGCIRVVLSSWKGMEMLQKRRDGRLSQHAFGGQSGKRETIGALKMCRTVYIMSK
ncbi:hypothetical protein MTR67_011282 [Solanum verrucosum]|uniref:Uncharacterized protein n=1 Tax=Solanum verrucosum TaxID=315347 RepID=A0AAF0Q7Q1_SOLVR|nr:hypothetical protein MTR67_011282 [Solanum verrucosum]